MKLYFHTDRADALFPGYVVEKEPYPDKSMLSVLSSFWDAAYLNHLQTLAGEGLSLHGAQYVIRLDGAVNFVSLATELCYEYIRWKEYPDRPSRLQSFFGWQRLEDAVSFASGGGRIYEIKCDGPIFIGDMNGLKLSYDSRMQDEHARRYWRGEPYRNEIDYAPRWECVMGLPVEIVREVLVSPTDGRLFGRAPG